MTDTITALPSSFDESMLELPFYTHRHRDLAGLLDRWCDEHAALLAPREGENPEGTGLRILRALGDSGWLAFLDPDGDPAGGDYRSLCLMREALAYAGDLADYAFSIQALSATPILRHGSDEQRRRYLPGMAAGTLCGAFAVSEESAGSDIAAVELSAEQVADGYVLNGRKAWIANAGIADVYSVIARTGPGPGALGLTAFLVPAIAPGVHVERVQVIAPRAFGALVFENCHVPADSVLGTCGGGFVVAVDLLDRFRMTVGAAALGFARRAADAALARTRSRPMLGGKLFDLQVVRATFADIEVKLDAAALLVARAAWEIDKGNRNVSRHSAMAKLHATEVAQEIVDASLQLFGAAGLVRDSPMEQLYRQIRSLRIYEGASEVQKMIIAGAIDPRRASRGAVSCRHFR